MHTDPARNTWRFALTARLLHWIVAVLIVCQLGLGWTMMTMEDDPGAGALFDLHKSVGLMVFALVAVRLGWRLAHPPAPLPASVAPWERTLANLVEWTLYACLVAMPLTGYLGASHQKHPPAFFGLPLPAWAAPDHDLAERFFGIHAVIAWLFAVLIVAHVAGALKHALIDRDGVFRRMSLGRKASREPGRQ